MFHFVSAPEKASKAPVAKTEEKKNAAAAKVAQAKKARVSVLLVYNSVQRL